MYAIDLRFSQFEEDLFRQTRESGFAATLATLGLTTSAAFVGGGASQVLSGIAAFIIGGREAFQKEVLAERTLVLIPQRCAQTVRASGFALGRDCNGRSFACLPAVPTASLIRWGAHFPTLTTTTTPGPFSARWLASQRPSARRRMYSRSDSQGDPWSDPDTNEPITSEKQIGGPAPATPKIEGARTPTEQTLPGLRFPYDAGLSLREG